MLPTHKKYDRIDASDKFEQKKALFALFHFEDNLMFYWCHLVVPPLYKTYSTVRHEWNGHPKIDKTKILIILGSLMKVESIVDAPLERPSILLACIK